MHEPLAPSSVVAPESTPISEEELLTEDDLELLPPEEERVSWFTRIRRGLYVWLIKYPFQLSSLVIVLALLSSVPVFQLIALGYLFEVSGRIARSGRLRDGFFLLDQAGKIGVAGLAVFLLSIPLQVLSNFSLASQLVNPDSGTDGVLRGFGFMLALVLGAHIGLVWFRGGGFWSYFRPRPIELVKTMSQGESWIRARDALWDFVASMQAGRLFWLGLRGMAATLLWIALPATILIVTTRNGQTGLAALVGIVGALMMSVVLVYLPLLQVKFSAENRFGAMFEVSEVRQVFRRAPFFGWLSFAVTLTFAVPLYLLKIEATPEELVWAPCILMVAFMLPARFLTGWAFAKGMRGNAKPGKRWVLYRCILRLLCVPFVLTYLLIVFLSTFTSWDGLATWFQQHALLVPVPFSAGV